MSSSDPIEPAPATAPVDPVTSLEESRALAPQSVPPSQRASLAPHARPSFVFFGVVAAISLVADVTSKAWAEIVLSKRTMVEPAIVLIPDHLALTLAYNRGGAWGLLQNASEMVRRPFFLLVSGLAIAFIVSLYGRLGTGQRALKWGLPLVLGGALGNLSDRIIRSSVIDFIDFRASWIEAMNRGIGKLVHGWGITDHWPTFNVADVSICVGVGLMAVDMFVSKRGLPVREKASHVAPEPALSAKKTEKPEKVAAAVGKSKDTPAKPESKPEPAKVTEAKKKAEVKAADVKKAEAKKPEVKKTEVKKTEVKTEVKKPDSDAAGKKQDKPPVKKPEAKSTLKQPEKAAPEKANKPELPAKKSVTTIRPSASKPDSSAKPTKKKPR